MKRAFLAIILLITAYSVSAVVDTLYHYDKSAGNTSYSQTKLQVARMEPAAPCTVHSVIVQLTGLGGDFNLRIFGHEAGTSFPQLEKDLITPINVVKPNTGLLTVQIDLDTPLYMPNNQFFIGFADINGLRIASDNVNHGTTCSSGSGGDYYYQFMKDNSGSWFLGNRAFKVDVIVEYETTTSPRHLVNETSNAGIDSTHSNNTIAWGDYNNDDHLDLMVAGNLYENNGGSFTNVTSTAGLNTGGFSIVGNALVDMNNDGWLDAVWICNTDTIVIYENNQDGTFTEHLVENMSGYRGYKGLGSFSFADIDHDKYPDLFISRLWTEYPSGGPDQVPNYLFMNDQNWGLTDNSSAVYPAGWQHRRSRGSQWVDFDDDGDLDLYVTNYYLERDELWWNNGGNFTNVISSKGIDINATSSNHGTGVDWYDYDNDGDMDLLLPQFAHPGFQIQYDHRGTTIYRNEGPPGYQFTDTKDDNGIRFEETHAGGAWGDVNNDGLADIYMSTYYGCRYVDIYDQQTDNSFALKTFDYGIQNIVSGQDGAWVDYDNDGRLDLAGGKGNKIRIWKNEGPFWSNFAEFDLVSTSGNHFAIGARLVVYAGGNMYTQEVSAGRGQRMQKPTRLHFGLGTAKSIDSVVVRWPNGTTNTEVFTGLDVNRIYRLTEGGATDSLFSSVDGRSAGSKLRVFPNPMADHITFEYELGNPAQVELMIYNTIGAEIRAYNYSQGRGKRFIRVQKEELPEISSPGVYFYSIAVNGVYRYSGKFIRPGSFHD